MDRPLVTCKIYGQIGNQLFQTATTLAYAWDYDAIPIFPGLHNPAWRISQNKDRLFFRLDASQPPRAFTHLFVETDWYSPARVPFQRDLVLEGYFQSWKHFDHHRTKIQEIFAPSDFTTHHLRAKYKEWLDHPNTVGVHVRTQSKRTHDLGLHPFWGIDYYRRAMDHFSTDAVFLIFSDRINWCKKHFPKLSKNCIYIEGNYGIEDLFFLAQCKHQILCNSSFSWWAAYLGQSSDKKVLFPLHWKTPGLHPNPDPESFFLPHWTLIDQLVRSPYPTDMFFFDQTSQSIDNHNN